MRFIAPVLAVGFVTLGVVVIWWVFASGQRCGSLCNLLPHLVRLLLLGLPLLIGCRLLLGLPPGLIHLLFWSLLGWPVPSMVSGSPPPDSMTLGADLFLPWSPYLITGWVQIQHLVPQVCSVCAVWVPWNMGVRCLLTVPVLLEPRCYVYAAVIIHLNSTDYELFLLCWLPFRSWFLLGSLVLQVLLILAVVPFAFCSSYYGFLVDSLVDLDTFRWIHLR